MTERGCAHFEVRVLRTIIQSMYVFLGFRVSCVLHVLLVRVEGGYKFVHVLWIFCAVDVQVYACSRSADDFVIWKFSDLAWTM